MRIAVVEQGVVTNVTIGGPGIECPPEVGPGWTHDGTAFIPPPGVTAPDPERPEAISDVQFFQGLTKAPFQIITEDEAEAANAAVIPELLLAIINGPVVAALLPPGITPFDIRMKVGGSTTFERHHVMTEILLAAFGWDEEQADAFWLFCSGL